MNLALRIEIHIELIFLQHEKTLLKNYLTWNFLLFLINIGNRETSLFKVHDCIKCLKALRLLMVRKWYV